MTKYHANIYVKKPPNEDEGCDEGCGEGCGEDSGEDSDEGVMKV